MITHLVVVACINDPAEFSDHLKSIKRKCFTELKILECNVVARVLDADLHFNLRTFIVLAVLRATVEKGMQTKKEVIF